MAAAACASGPEPAPTAHRTPAPSPTDTLIASLPRADLTPAGEVQRTIDAVIDGHFARAASRRTWLMTDKPLYQPGETLWFRAELRQTATLVAGPQVGVTALLISPRGATAAEKRVLAKDGFAANDFIIPPEAEGGEYTLKVVVDDGTVGERKIIVNTYEAPRLQKNLELLRKAYGPGDPVTASLQVKRSTGEPFAARAVTAVATVDDVEIARLPVTLDHEGKGIIRFDLPASIERGDGLLTVLAPDGGVTESVQKRIPILLKSLDLALFPEGGDLIEGLPGRVYLEAKNSMGKPADVEGRVVDDRGAEVATFKSVHDGMARFDVTPAAGRAYRVEITRPTGIAKTFEVPAAKRTGCVLRSVDPFDELRAGGSDDLEIAAWCSQAQTLVV